MCEKHLFFPIFFLFLIGVHASSSATATATTGDASLLSSLHHLSFRLCRADDECARRFYIDGASPSPRSFAYLLDRFMDDMPDSSQSILHRCMNESAAPELHAVWTMALARAKFCTENEEFTRGVCQCRSGKTCHESPSSHYAFDRISLNVLLAAFLAVVLYYTVQQVRVMSQVRDATLKLYKKF